MKKALLTVAVSLMGLFSFAIPALANTNASPILTSPVPWTFTGTGTAGFKITSGDATGNLGDCSGTYQVNAGSASQPFDLVAAMNTEPAGLYTLELGATYTTFGCSGYGIRGNSSTGAGSGDLYGTFTWDGTAITPSPDGNTTTHVIRWEQPQLYATTTSPVAVSFDIYNNSTGDSEANVYKLTFINSLNYNTVTVFGNLDGTTRDQPITISTSTPLTGDGTWKLYVQLGQAPSSSFPADGAYGIGADINPDWFGLNTNDNVTTITSGTGVSFSFASTSCAISFSGSFSLSDCLGYVFLPSQNAFSGYTALPQKLSTKFPFSYVASVATAWTDLQASTTDNAPDLTYNLHNLGVGSTTALGNFLPNTTVFSASTTKQYFPASSFDLLKGLASAAIWLTFFGYVFFNTRNLIRT